MMVTSWAVALPAVKTLLSTLTGLQVEPEQMPQPFVNPALRGKITYNVTSCSSIGGPFRNYVNEQGWTVKEDGSHEPLVDDNDDPVMVNHLYLEELKAFTLSMRFDGYDQTVGRNALYYLERIATRINLPEHLESLRAVNVAFCGAGPYTALDSADDDRIFSRGSKDLFLTLGVSELASDADVGYIQSLSASSHYLLQPGGVTPAGYQITLDVP